MHGYPSISQRPLYGVSEEEGLIGDQVIRNSGYVEFCSDGAASLLLLNHVAVRGEQTAQACAIAWLRQSQAPVDLRQAFDEVIHSGRSCRAGSGVRLRAVKGLPVVPN